MAVFARSVKDLPRSDESGMVDMRTGGRPRAGTYPYEGNDLVTTWHSHDLHQIEYAVHGVVEVETAVAHYLLPPQQAVWIPAGLRHQTTIATSVRTVSVFFDPTLVPEAGHRARILGVAPVIREMIVYGLRWPIERSGSEPEADAFFAVLGRLVAHALDDEAPLSLPTSTEPVMAAALAYTNSHLDAVSVADVRAVGVSERTLRRQFRSELAMSWRYLSASGPPPPQYGAAGRTRPHRAPGGHHCRLRQCQRLRPGLLQSDRRDAIGLPSSGQCRGWDLTHRFRRADRPPRTEQPQEDETSAVAGSRSSTTFRMASERSVVHAGLYRGPVPSVRSRLAAATPRAGTGSWVERAPSSS